MAAEFEIYKNSAGKWSWRLTAANGRKVATAGESFSSEAAARRATRTAKDRAAVAIVPAKAGGASRKASPDAAKAGRSRAPKWGTPRAAAAGRSAGSKARARRP